jgi:hypothetical protein
MPSVRDSASALGWVGLISDPEPQKRVLFSIYLVYIKERVAPDLAQKHILTLGSTNAFQNKVFNLIGLVMSCFKSLKDDGADCLHIQSCFMVGHIVVSSISMWKDPG